MIRIPWLSTMSFQIGDSVGGYKIVGVVGAGGVGQVFKVEHSVTGRIEAMKVLAGRAAGGKEEAQRFLREIKVQAKLSHPNIAAVHNAFWLHNDLVMIMELIDGDSLQRILERGPIPLPSALDYTCQALSALSYSHANGVVHRDIKPANLIVTSNGTVKLTDFGLAKTFADPQLTESGAVIGSLYYISPEQVKGLPALDARTDLYSLGVVLYEAVTRKRPFDAEQAYSLMVAHVSQEPRPPIEMEPALPSALNEIILTALRKEPVERFQTADEFRDAVDRVRRELAGAKTGGAAESERGAAARGKEASRTPAAQPKKPVKFPKPAWAASASAAGARARRRIGAHWGRLPRALRSRGAAAGITAAAVGVVLLAGLLHQPSAADPSSREGIEQVEARPAATNPPEPAPADAPRGEVPASDESAARIEEKALEVAESAPAQPSPPPPDIPPREETTEAPGGEQLRSEEAAAAEASSYKLIRSLRADPDVWAVAFSPDGHRLVAGMGKRHLKVFDTATGRELASLTGHQDRVVAVSFSPDGRRVASGSWDGTARLWQLETGAERARFKHKNLVTSVTFSPEGRYLASGSNDNTLKIWSMDGGDSVLDLRGHKREAQALAFSPSGQWLASVSAEKTVRLWPVARGSNPHELTGPEFGATAVAFSADGRLLAVAGGNRLKVWDVATKRELQEVDAPGWLHALTPTRQGSFLALSATPEAVKLWDVAKAEELATIVRGQAVRSVALSPGGRRVAAAAEGGKIGVWEAGR